MRAEKGGEILNDSEIIELFNNRDEKAIEEAQKKYGTLCARVSKNILHNYWDAEECVNEALWKAWDSIPPQKPKYFSAFLVKIAKNIALNKYKAQHSEKRGNGVISLVLEETEDLLLYGSLEEETERKEIIKAINAFLEKQPAKKRIIFVRRYWFCDSVSQIAADNGISEGSVSVMLHRTREKLKKYLQKRGF